MSQVFARHISSKTPCLEESDFYFKKCPYLFSYPPDAPTGSLPQYNRTSGLGKPLCPGHTAPHRSGLSGLRTSSGDQTQLGTSPTSNSPPTQTTRKDLDKCKHELTIALEL